MVHVIYILGISYSGSTIIGIHIAASNNVLYLGEVKALNRDSNLQTLCTCNRLKPECPFWLKYHQDYFDIYDRPGLLGRLQLIVAIMLKKPIQKKQIRNSEDHRFFKTILGDKRKSDRQQKYVLDNSKSIWRLTHLLKCTEMEVSVIYIKRNVYANVASFKKHKSFGFIRGLFTYMLGHFLIRRFMKINSIPYLKIDYTEFCLHPQKVLNNVGAFLELDYSNYEEILDSKEFHVVSGNSGTINQFKEGATKLKVDDSWKMRLNRVEQFAVKLLC